MKTDGVRHEVKRFAKVKKEDVVVNVGMRSASLGNLGTTLLNMDSLHLQRLSPVSFKSQNVIGP